MGSKRSDENNFISGAVGKGKLFLFFEARKNEMCLVVRLDFVSSNLQFQ